MSNESHYHSKKDRTFVRAIAGPYNLKDELARLRSMPPRRYGLNKRLMLAAWLVGATAPLFLQCTDNGGGSLFQLAAALTSPSVWVPCYLALPRSES